MTRYSIEVFSDWLPGKGHVLWTPGREYMAIFNELKYLLFAGHQPSYYGTLINSGSHRDRPVIFPSPLFSLELFAGQTWSREVEWRWSEELLTLLETAPGLKQALALGHWRPDFRKRLDGRRGWRLDLDHEPELRDALDRIPYLNEWLDLIIEELIQRNPGLGRAWDKLAANYPLLAPGQPASGDEETWLEAVGWKQNLTPFKTCLELAEPANNDGPWRLNIILQDKEDPYHIAEWEPGGSSGIPPDWLPHTNRIPRDIAGWAAILPWLVEDDGGQQELRRELGEAEAWELLHTGSLELALAGHTVLLPKWWEEIKNLVPALKIRTRSSVGSSRQSSLGLSQIVRFDWSVAVGDLRLTQEEFRQIADKKRRLIQIQGKWIRLDSSLLKKIQRLISKGDGLSLADVLHMSLPGAPADDLQVDVELDRQLAQMLEQLNNTSSIPVLDTAASFRGSLRKYQQAGTSWLLFLRRFGLGCCLADDMGLGKTIQWIAYVLKAREMADPASPSLLICPTSVLGNWQKELARFAPDLKFLLHYGPQRARKDDFATSVQGCDIVITSYNLAHLDEEELSRVEWDCICLDEAQNIKNSYTKQATAVRKLRGRHRIALTGTPMENRLTELWSIFNFLNPGYLGSSGDFSRKFVGIIEKKGDQEDIARVQRLIRPFLLRRVKGDPAIELDLPEKQEQKEYIPLTVEQASLYEGVLQDLFEKLENVNGMARRGLILSALSKLKQLCDHPALMLKEEKPRNISKRSHKVGRLLELIEQLRRKGERCLIFTQFVRMGLFLQEAILKELGEQSYYLHGGTPKGERDEMVARFQEMSPDIGNNIFILSLKAGGLGLNLTAANHVFHFDRWWNPAVENQATDRSHRIGQSRHVMVHKFISLGTMEERIDEMLERKTGMSNRILGAGEAWITEISTGELRELFSLRREWIGEVM